MTRLSKAVDSNRGTSTGKDSRKAKGRQLRRTKKATKYHLRFVGKSTWRTSEDAEVLLLNLSQLESRKPRILAVSIYQIKDTPDGGREFTIAISGPAKSAGKEVGIFKRTIKNLGLTILSCDTV